MMISAGGLAFEGSGVGSSAVEKAAQATIPGHPGIRAQKGRLTMPSSSQSASICAPASAGNSPFSSQKEDWVYQAFTVAAILLVLFSL